MVKRELTKRKHPVSPNHGTALPGTTPTPPLSAVAGTLAHSRLLDSVAAFTHHRDTDALDHSLVLSLAELVSARCVSLAKRAASNHRQLESVVRCILDEHGRHRLQVIEPDSADQALIPLRHCMEQQSVYADVTEAGIHRLAVPILCEDRAIGALLLESEVPASASLPLVHGFACIYANYTTLLNESERDKLTGLYNRRTFERHLRRLLQDDPSADPDDPTATPEVPEIERRQPPESGQVWLAIFDIDHFKLVNDNFGHILGDEVILLLAQQMRACFRESDVLFRFGGEEFVILLSAKDELTVNTALERFRRHVDEYAFPQVKHVTVSIGYARIGEHDYPETVLDRADKALYFAKENGRNRIHGYETLAAQGLLGNATASGSIDLF
jgi:diguanylate cyclase (GGDEF)-like protein